MAIVKMQKMSLVAHASERSKLLRTFVRQGSVEIVKSEVVENTSFVDDPTRREVIDAKLLKVSFAVSFFKEMLREQNKIDKEKAPKLNFKKENRLVELDEYYDAAKDEIELFSVIDGLEKINSSLVEIKSERARNLALKEQLAVFAQVDTPFSEFKNTEKSISMLGAVPSEKADALVTELAELAFVKVYARDKQSAVAVIAHAENSAEVLAALTRNDFVRSSFDFDDTAAGKIAELENKNNELDKKRVRLVAEALENATYLTRFKVLYDYYDMEIAKMDCMADCPRTQKAFILEAWVPAEKVEALKAEINEKCKRVVLFFRDPTDDENPPTLIKSDGFTDAFSGITEMFGLPGYRARDPNIFVALYYFLFFGIMISDAGYGVIMALACFLFVKLTKPVKNSGRMMLMFGFCGLSTLLWGALFGGWFAITIPEGSFFDKITWFNPLEEPLKMFMLALGMGALQIGTGFLLKGLDEIKSGAALHGIFNQFSWVIIFIGLFCLSPNMMVFWGAINPDPVPAAFAVFSKIGTYVAIAGFAMLLIGGAIGKKNPVKMVTGALGNAYGAINVVSDLLSYSRLFGLGLTTGVIGYVVNMLGDIVVNTFFHGAWFAWIIAAPILVGGHIFNLAINLLGAYVHDSRLQYIEFFGRFYEAGGHAFKPLGSKTKYTYVNN